MRNKIYYVLGLYNYLASLGSLLEIFFNWNCSFQAFSTGLHRHLPLHLNVCSWSPLSCSTSCLASFFLALFHSIISIYFLCTEKLAFCMLFSLQTISWVSHILAFIVTDKIIWKEIILSHFSFEFYKSFFSLYLTLSFQNRKFFLLYRGEIEILGKYLAQGHKYLLSISVLILYAICEFSCTI